MILTSIEQQFAGVGIIRAGCVFLLRASDALRFIDECEHRHIPLHGLEGFKVCGDLIQPCQEHSIDLYGVETNSHAILIRFIEERLDSDVWYDVGNTE